MKPTVIACLILLPACPPALGATVCQVIEYPDRSELICIGDEKNPAEPATSPATSPGRPVAASAESRKPAPAANPEPAPASTAAARENRGSATSHGGATAGAAASDRKAAHLQKRKELAERTTRSLNSSANSTPSGP